MKNFKKEIIQGIKIVTLALMLSVGVSYVFADWTPPLATPPGCTTGQPGCDAPIHVGSVGQTKVGNLIINGQNAAGTPYANGLLVLNGRVGVGTASPDTKFTVQAAGANGINLAPDTGDTQNSGRLFFSNIVSSASNAFSILASNQELQLRYNAVPGSSSGKVGLIMSSSTNGSLIKVPGSIQIQDGTEGVGRVLTSDANGLASWTTFSGSATSSGSVSYDSGWFPIATNGKYITGAGGIPTVGTIRLPYVVTVYTSATNNGTTPAVVASDINGGSTTFGVITEITTSGEVRLHVGTGGIAPANTPNFTATGGSNATSGFARIVISKGGSGGTGGSITNITGGPNITITNPTGPTVTVSAPTATLCTSLGGTWSGTACSFGGATGGGNVVGGGLEFAGDIGNSACERFGSATCNGSNNLICPAGSDKRQVARGTRLVADGFAWNGFLCVGSGSAGGGVGSCIFAETGNASTEAVEVSLLSGARNICDDGAGCTYKVWRYTTAKPAGSSFYGSSGVSFRQISDGNWHDAEGNETGINGDSTKTTIFNWSDGLAMYDDDSAVEVDRNKVTIKDNSTTGGFRVAICD
ncbi:MAG: hypothetical protein RJA61_316 [Candidatus Parcubacteria bacterium]|jgi:hypothetical protein